MSVRSGRVVKTVRTLGRPNSEATICGYSNYNCSLGRLEGFEYCSRHILEDKSAPFRQCNYIFTSTGKRCLRPAPTTDRKEGYCGEHSRRSLVVRQRAARKRPPRETTETLLTQLSHHQMDTATIGQNAIPDPGSVVSVAATCLEYGSDTDSEEEGPSLSLDALRRREADSELDSADSDTDPLEHAQVYTTEEITRIYLEKLQKLKSMYVGEFKRLSHLLRESRRKYLQQARNEKETMCSIHAQPKETPEERNYYEKLKAMARYHKHLGVHAILQRQQFERRLQVTEGVNYKPGPSVGCVKCIYNEGSWRCGEKSIPLSKYCAKHILHDPNQVLFNGCGASVLGEDQCSVPIIPLPHISTCIYHTPVPDPLPVSVPIEDLEATLVAGEEASIAAELPTPHGQIIDLSHHSFILTEVPPENVMEGDDQAQPDNMESQMLAPLTGSDRQSGIPLARPQGTQQTSQQFGSPASMQHHIPTQPDTSHLPGISTQTCTNKKTQDNSFSSTTREQDTLPMELEYSQASGSSVNAAGNSSNAATTSNQKPLPSDPSTSGEQFATTS